MRCYVFLYLLFLMRNYQLSPSAERKGQLSNFYYEDLEELHLLEEQIFIDKARLDD